MATPNPQIRPPQTIAPEVLDALRRGTFSADGTQFNMPPLDRAIYAKVKPVLQALGGTWTRRLQTHVFSQDARAALEMVIDAGVYVDPKRAYGCFFTPEPLASQVVTQAKISAGMQVLEPSAGIGNLAKPARTRGAAVQVVELLDENVTQLQAAGFEIIGFFEDGDPSDPKASPVVADYAGFPPLLIQVGTRERLLSDAEQCAEKAQAAGVEVTLHRYEDLVHVWQLFGPHVPESQDALDEIGAFVRKHVS